MIPLVRVKLIAILSIMGLLGATVAAFAFTDNRVSAPQAAAAHKALQCVVPSLRGEGARAARRALLEAYCELGKVTLLGKPSTFYNEPSAFYKQDSSYMVTEQSVSAGTVLPVNSAVAVQLGPAPAGLVSYRVPSGSMEPSFPIGTTVWVQTRSYSPAVGDVVVLHPPADAEQEKCGPVPHTVKLGGAACAEPVPKDDTSVKFLKRVAAGPADEIYIKSGHVFRKAAGASRFLRELGPYIKACGASPECNFPSPITIPAGHWFVLGDNRGESDDSRFYGPVPTSWIIGHVVYCTTVGVPCPPASKSRKP
jgi:signal peptidase I